MRSRKYYTAAVSPDRVLPVREAFGCNIDRFFRFIHRFFENTVYDSLQSSECYTRAEVKLSFSRFRQQKWCMNRRECLNVTPSCWFRSRSCALAGAAWPISLALQLLCAAISSGRSRSGGLPGAARSSPGRSGSAAAVGHVPGDP